jgi:uncharacterized membrane protein
MSELAVFQTYFQVYLDRLRELRADERGMTTETVIITAVLAALALGATAIIVNKVTSKANSIDTGG